MKKYITKFVSVSLCAVLIVSSIGATVYALNSNKTENKVDAIDNAAVEEEEEISKDETVYVFASADGSVKKIIVSDWIKNTLGSADISDKTELTDVENIKGDEKYSINGNDMKVWDADGNDIYYQGNIEKELPVGITVSYKLDGKSISAEQLAGKSGKVTIRFDYDNRQYETVTMDGRQEKIYVPFAMMTGMLLDNDVFTNVEVSNGKLINDGDHMAVVGIAFPGLQSNLGIDTEKLEFPDYVEITADVKNFEFGMTVTMATNDIFNSIDADKLDSLNNVTESLDELTSAMSQLINGSSELYGGICTLLNKSGELVEGINKLAAGGKELKDGVVSLDDGAAQLKDGMAELYVGLSTLSSNNETLTGGAKQVFNTLLSNAKAQLEASGITIPALTIDNYSNVLNGVIASLNGNGAVEGAMAVTSLKASLDSYNTFYLGLINYTDGVSFASKGAAELNAGAGELKNGTAKLSAGVDELYNGILQLKDGAPALLNGVTKLSDGAMQLSEGLEEFNEKGVQKLVDAVDKELGSLMTRLKATIDISKEYKSFAGISDGMDGQVKFIYRTESVKVGE